MEKIKPNTGLKSKGTTIEYALESIKKVRIKPKKIMKQTVLCYILLIKYLNLHNINKCVCF